MLPVPQFAGPRAVDVRAKQEVAAAVAQLVGYGETVILAVASVATLVVDVVGMKDLDG